MSIEENHPPCPFCNKKPCGSIYTGELSCCGFSVNDIEREKRDKLWRQHVAAMKFVLATVALERAMEPLNSGRTKMPESAQAIQEAMVNERTAEMEVLREFM